MKEKFDIERSVPLPWGLWATLGFSAIIALAFVLTQVLVVIVYGMYSILKDPSFDIHAWAESVKSNGLVMSLSTISTAIVGIGLVILFMRIRKGISIREYLCLVHIEWRTLAKWCGVGMLFIVAFDSTSLLIDHPIVPETDLKMLATAYYAPLLWFAIVIAAPLFEEILFRGFLFKGIQYSILGPVGAVVITSAVWAGIHIRYDIYDIIAIFLCGLMFGFARYKSNSLYPSLAMHSILNVVATVETTIALIK